MPESNFPFAFAFDQSSETDDLLPHLGGKCMSLVKMTRLGVPVPAGFALSTSAWQAMCSSSNIQQKIDALLSSYRKDDVSEQERISAQIRSLFLSTPLPPNVNAAIAQAYSQLCRLQGNENLDLPVAVRSSATAEDLPDASFAGQQDTFLWVVGTEAVCEKVRECWASLYTARAIGYREDRGIPHSDVAMAVGIQKMVNASVAGVVMTLNPSNGDRTRTVVDASWGLGESVVSGEVTPDHFVVDKVLRQVISRTICDKETALIPDYIAKTTKRVPVEERMRHQACLSDEQVIAVAEMARKLERAFGGAQDVEWAFEEVPGQEQQRLQLLQSRPETVWSQRKAPASATQGATGMAGLVENLLKPVEIKL